MGDVGGEGNSEGEGVGNSSVISALAAESKEDVFPAGGLAVDALPHKPSIKVGRMPRSVNSRPAGDKEASAPSKQQPMLIERDEDMGRPLVAAVMKEQFKSVETVRTTAPTHKDE